MYQQKKKEIKDRQKEKMTTIKCQKFISKKTEKSFYAFFVLIAKLSFDCSISSLNITTHKNTQ